MPDITVNVAIFCDRCGAVLCGQSIRPASVIGGEPQFRVRPCEKCLSVAKNAGDFKGYNRGYKDGCLEAGDKTEVEV